MEKKFMPILFTLLTCVSLFAGCVKQNNTISSAEELNKPGMKVGTVQGPASMYITEEKFPNAEIDYFPTVADGCTAMSSGQLDGFVFTAHILEPYARASDNIAILDDIIGYAYISAAMKKGNTELKAKTDAFIETIKADGTLDDMKKRWTETADPVMPEIKKPENTDGILRIATEGLSFPFTYFGDNGELTGLDIEFGTRLAYYLNMDVCFTSMSFDGLFPALESDNADIVLNEINETPERRETVLFSEPYYISDVVVAVKKGSGEQTEKKVDHQDDFSGKKIGIMTGSAAVMSMEKEYPDAEVVEINSISDAVEMLKAGKLDYVLSSRSTCKNFAKYNDELCVIDEEVISGDKTAAYIAVNKDNTELLCSINDILDRYLEDGTITAIEENWLGDNAVYDMSNIPEKADAPVLKVGMDVSDEPMEFILNGENAGYDCELIERIAYELGMRVEYENMNFPSLIPALQSGKVDVVISDITATDERREMVDFTEPYYANPQVLLTRKDNIIDAVISTEESVSEGFIDKLKASFTRTFITENRWKLVLSGLGVTILISLSAFVIGSLWGGVICAGLRSGKKIASVPARIYVRLLQGTPIVVLLMILYYIVFKSFDISAVIVAIIGFSLNLGAYTSEIFRTAIDSVDKGQIEAASAIGFSKFKVFTKIIFPQAARNALPVYKGEFISLVKSTSIVGYIAIQDLTKASDIIRSRTYEAFFPLITTAIIYFAVTYIFIVLLNVLEKKIDPKRRKRTLKGVDIK